MIYGIISEFTDKGHFHYLTKLKGPQVGELPVYNTISFAAIKINNLIPSWDHFIAPAGKS